MKADEAFKISEMSSDRINKEENKEKRKEDRLISKFRRKIRKQINKYARMGYDEIWVIIPDRYGYYFKKVERELQEDGYSTRIKSPRIGFPGDTFLIIDWGEV